MCDPYTTWTHAQKLLHQKDKTNMRHGREANKKMRLEKHRERIEYVSAFFNEIRLTIDKVCACECILCVRYCSVDSCVWMTNTEFFFPAASDFPWKFVCVVVIFFPRIFYSFSSSSSFRFRLSISVSWSSAFFFLEISNRLKFFSPQNKKLVSVARFIQLFAYFYFKICDIAPLVACAM